MARDGRLTVQYPSTRGSSVTQEVYLDAKADPARITFKQCDPMCLPAGLSGMGRAIFLCCFFYGDLCVKDVRLLYVAPNVISVKSSTAFCSTRFLFGVHLSVVELVLTACSVSP